MQEPKPDIILDSIVQPEPIEAARAEQTPEQTALMQQILKAMAAKKSKHSVSRALRASARIKKRKSKR
jgi:hypothetical protein